MKNVDIGAIMREVERGVAEFVGVEQIRALIERFYKTGEHFYIKLGADPTAADLHLGHTVVLNKMAQLQKHGAIVQFLVGDFTAKIGDPSGKSATRKMLDDETIARNAKTYTEQVFKILDESKTQILRNSTWMREVGADGLIALASTFSVARMLERDDFTKRYKAQTPIAISEFLYPLLQGYDSVVMKCDVEFGGTDQKFNLLMGRTLQRTYGVGKEQAVVMLPLLVGTDGVHKMSKSLGNYIGVTDEPAAMFGKVMSISDELMWSWFELLSAKSLDEIAALRAAVASGAAHPKAAKESLAGEIVARYHGADAAAAAQAEFNAVHSGGGGALPSDMPRVAAAVGAWLPEVLVGGGLVASTSEARRLIGANAVSIDGAKVADWQFKFSAAGEFVVKVGKLRFARVVVG